MQTLALPDRPLKLSRSARPRYLGALFGAFVLLLIGGFIMVWQLPGLQRDWSISRNPVLVPDGDVQNGECTTRKGIFTDCEAHLSYVVDGQQYETDVALMFVDFHSGDYWVDIVRSGDNPGLATMSIGIDKLWNRLIVLGLFMLLLIGGGLVLLWQGAQNMRAAGQLAQKGRMEAIPVTIAAVTDAGRRTNVTIRDPAGRKPKKQYISGFGKAEEPLILEGPTGEAVGIAVRHEGSPVPVLLDRGLARLDLTAEERAAALASIRA
jgi:hypothetical protein